MKLNKEAIGEMIRFSVVGVLVTVIHYVVYWLLQLVLKQGLIFNCFPLPPPILDFPYAGQQFSCCRWLVISSPFPSKPEGLEPLMVLPFLGHGCFDFLFPLLVPSMEKGFRQTASYLCCVQLLMMFRVRCHS